MIAEYLKMYGKELFNLLTDMAPWLMLGFLIAGILHIFLPQQKINAWMGGKNTRSVINAALFGIPLPLCSCGVIPTGISFYKNGASKGSSVSFLISTPQTGVDSIMVTYSLLGLPFAIIRPIVALVTGFFGGFITNLTDKKNTVDAPVSKSNVTNNNGRGNAFVRMFNYAFVEFLQDIAKWLIIGLLIAALIAVFVPDDFFASYLKSNFLGMLIILVASIPVYVCATSSVPIAAVLILKGLSPGAALVFLMAGPATNAATMTVIGKVMGRKTLITYLATIILGALTFGLIIDYLLPQGLFTRGIVAAYSGHAHGLLPEWLKVASGITLVALIINSYLQKYLRRKKSENSVTLGENLKYSVNMNEIKVIVKGMTCNHCKMNVENSIKKLSGIESVMADVDRKEVTLRGDNISMDEIKSAVEGIGYEFAGVKE